MTSCALSADYCESPYLFTNGFSDTADYIRKSAKSIHSRLQESNYFGVQSKVFIKQLDEVANECKESGWDGYNAFPVIKRTIDLTRYFFSKLPSVFSPPTIGAEPDGSITLEWYRSPSHVFSISISSDAYIHYAYINGKVKRHGSEPLGDYISRDIVKLIDDIVRYDRI